MTNGKPVKIDRRTFLKVLIGVPVVGSFLLFLAPVLRYLKPTLGPETQTTLDTKGKPFTKWTGKGGIFTAPDMPTAEKEIRFPLSDFPKPWSSQTFTFGQRSKEYTFSQFQSTKIPGYVVRLPQDQADGKPDFYIISRICPHMGCVFNFLEDPKEAGSYNYPQADHPHFACPCHLSVFDPLAKQVIEGKEMLGKVVSGPAPRPPRQFEWAIQGNDLLITRAEAGGIS